ncbi:hypothetical protein JWJ90_01840 [Desulfobulbus rhabdoformis]|uniref:hypothetical protein n=1 Tax=Desulfobulbus rhabdoformis TaxID=34032 RepID=UPI001962ADA3|nr:hypothetical protein [Desulfobulbus rhabdoformis]MBM9613022.1 hypothetical protein [Desulfobulbus rhabdoformis]
MSAGHSSQPLLSSRETLAVITARVKERRLYEARFLSRQLGQGLTAEQRATLDEQLNKSLGQVEQLHAEAKAAFTSGNYERAGILYSQIKAVAIDVPGVREELQALRGATALAQRFVPAEKPVAQDKRQDDAEASASMEILTAPGATQEPPPVSRKKNVSSGTFFLLPRSIDRKWLLSGIGLLLLGGGFFVLFQQGDAPPSSASSTPDTPPSKAVALIKSVPKQAKVIKGDSDAKVTVTTAETHAEAEAPSISQEPASPQSEPVETPEKPVAPTSPALNLGGLQIE